MRLVLALLLTACSGSGPSAPAPPPPAMPPPTDPPPDPPSDPPPLPDDRASEEEVETTLVGLAYAIDRDPDPLHFDVTPAVIRLGEIGTSGAIVTLSLLDAPDEATRLHAERALERAIFRDVRTEIARGASIAVDPYRGMPAHLDARARTEAEAAVRAIGSIHDASDRAPAIARARGYLEGRPFADIARGNLVTIAIARTLYERAGSPGFFVRVRISNDSLERVGVDLRTAREVPYLNQWGASRTPYRMVVDESRMIFPPLAEAERDALRADHRAGALEVLDPGASIEIYRPFGGSSRADVEAQQRGHDHVVLVFDGRLRATDGTRIDDLRLDELLREVPALTPVRFERLPARARVVE